MHRVIPDRRALRVAKETKVIRVKLPPFRGLKDIRVIPVRALRVIKDFKEPKDPRAIKAIRGR